MTENAGSGGFIRSVEWAFRRPGYDDFGPSDGLAALPAADKRQWLATDRPAIRDRWLALLGQPAFDREGFTYAAEKTGELVGEQFSVQAWQQLTGPGHRQKVFILEPAKRLGEPAPCAVIPFYHPEKVCGVKMLDGGGALEWEDPAVVRGEEVRLFGAHLARMGFVVACVEAFPFNTIPKPPEAEQRAFAWWEQAAARLLSDHPDWTGMGKLVHDTSRAVDLLLAQPGVDPSRVLIMGHSLGGKMAFYTGALDERIACTVGSDFGLPWQSTNWQAEWYLGRRVPADSSAMANHELLALLAPRPFFLIAGQTDDRVSWQHIEAARRVYDLFGCGHRIGGIDHASGHSPTVAALEVTYRRILEAFDIGYPRAWR